MIIFVGFSIIFLLSSHLFYGFFILFPIFIKQKDEDLFIKKSNSKNKCLIIIPVLNGEKFLESRVENIIQNCSPIDYDLNIVSDGSTDGTIDLANKIKEKEFENSWNILIDENSNNIGRALTHNQAIKKYNYAYYLFSDLDTEFTNSFPYNSLEYLKKNKNCLAVSGRVVFRSKNKYGNFLGNLYKFETLIRKLSDKSNLCMKGSGPALIIKKCCWQDLEEYEDVDHCIGFMTMRNNGYLKYAFNSIVFDIANDSEKKDLRARRRMTRKSLLSFFHQLFDLRINSFRSLILVIGYMIHKPLRFLILPLISFLWILFFYKAFGLIFLILFSLFLTISPYLRVFIVINISYILGIFDFLLNRNSGTYKPVNEG